MSGTDTRGIDEPLTRGSHWFEVPWGEPVRCYVASFAARAFHPSQTANEEVLRAMHPVVAAWLGRELPGRWRFVRRHALYNNQLQTAWHETLFLFDERDDAERFAAAHRTCHALEVRETPPLTSNLERWTQGAEYGPGTGEDPTAPPRRRLLS